MLPNYERPKLVAQPKGKLRFHEKRESAKEQAANWRKLAVAVTKRDGKHCRVTGERHGLDLHHLLMRSLGGKDELHNLIWLSRDTHRAVHGHALRFFWTDDKNRAGTCWWEWV